MLNKAIDKLILMSQLLTLMINHLSDRSPKNTASQDRIET